MERTWRPCVREGVQIPPHPEMARRLAHLESKTLIEIEGGIYINGRHNRPAGFADDLEKYLEAALAGWRVIRLGPNELNADRVGRIIRLVTDDFIGEDTSSDAQPY